MTHKTTLIASLGAVALILATGAASADPGAARGAGLAPSRPAFPAFPRHHNRGGGFFPGVVYGATNDVRDVVVEAPPVASRTDELRYTCVLDIPWDYVHRCPQFTTPR
jgi:hypothetical protein